MIKQTQENNVKSRREQKVSHCVRDEIKMYPNNNNTRVIKEESKKVKQLFKLLNEEDEQGLGEEIDEIQITGKYEESGEKTHRK